MSRKRLIWQLFPTYLLITFLSLVAMLVMMSRAARIQYEDHLAVDLEARARLLTPTLMPLMTPEDFGALDVLCKKLGSESRTRISVSLPDGRIVGDSEEDPALMANYQNRPEIQAALKGQSTPVLRYSETLGRRMMYVAIPVFADAKIAGIIRTSVDLMTIDETLNRFVLNFAWVAAIVLTAATIMSWLMANRIVRPIQLLKTGAQRFALGDLEKRLPIPNAEEIAGLAEAMNEMASQLDNRIRAIVQQRNEQEAVLSSMVECVIAVDKSDRILSINKAGAQMFGVNAEKVQNQSLEMVIRTTALQGFVARALQSTKPITEDLIIHNNGDRDIQATGTRLRDESGAVIGAVVVLNDVTHLRRLETVRRDFVANVSHELKTPITSIKGFVETLLDGALQSPEDAERFLRIVSKQADRLNAIIEDLLTLSRIEQNNENTENMLKTGSIREVVDAAVLLCKSTAGQKSMTLDTNCDITLLGRINAALLEQGLVNLIDNAIKYSDPGKTVYIEAHETTKHLVISVRDEGCGIPKEHIPRLFERFYRVDKARSRNLGGTGLGLAIVKHIAHAHHGRINVKSAINEGSTFSLYLPKMSEDLAVG
ncbi:MAG: PAS domain-containing protein [Candidatus Hydrogenedentes bacterium]|nr:PAS domain-containing protein [Candidatus Hydrogenedentota bacterium]